MSDGPGPAKAISVDVDGTLYRVHKIRVAWRLRWERGLLIALMAAREKIRHEPPLPDGEQLLHREAELVAPSFGLSHDEALQRVRDLRAALSEALTRDRRPYRGVIESLQAAHAQGIALAVLSDFSPKDKLRWLGLDELPWRVAVGAEELGALKPHPRSFEAVMEGLGVDPGEIVHVGDREDLDVEGALGAGLRAWRFSRRETVPTKAEATFHQWSAGLFGPLYPGSSGDERPMT